MLLADMPGGDIMMLRGNRGTDVHDRRPGLDKRADSTASIGGIGSLNISSPTSTFTNLLVDSSAGTSSKTITSPSDTATANQGSSTSATSRTSRTSNPAPSTATPGKSISDTSPSWISEHKLTLAGIIAAFLALAIAIAFVIITLCRRAKRRRTEEEKARQSFFAGAESTLYTGTAKTKKALSRGNSVNTPSALEMSTFGFPVPSAGNPGPQGKFAVSAGEPSLKSNRSVAAEGSSFTGVDRPPSIAPSIPPPPTSSPFMFLTEAFKATSDESVDYFEPSASIRRDLEPPTFTRLRPGPEHSPQSESIIVGASGFGSDSISSNGTPVRSYAPSARSDVALIEGTAFPRPPPSPQTNHMSTHTTLYSPTSPQRPSFDTTSTSTKSAPQTLKSSSSLVHKSSKTERKRNIRALENLIAALDDAASEGGSISLTDASLGQPPVEQALG
ncbi:uncharacterized protein EI90DRAFT_394674 [Cantharellus anzutake]|uniref:uncharacterized protein n=1 Tax=Cantharellus anzutake TaxID=1750568 RepID=UPI0019034B67|nr:uncharacterized protein EI90DRAFT_394674 [Cantharellus anzutake]KAF8335054.1 hypothetical protein EI90DRAFT_394674 [Cantharellus anzutake]